MPSIRRLVSASPLAMLLACLGAFAAPPTTDGGAPAVAAPGDTPRWGLGVVLGGEPTGLLLERRIGPRSGVQVAADAKVRDSEASVRSHVDLLRYIPVETSAFAGETALYLGVGAHYGRRHDDDEFGVRLPIGMSLCPGSAPLEIRVEVAPAFVATPERDEGELDFSGGLGLLVRF